MSPTMASIAWLHSKGNQSDTMHQALHNAMRDQKAAASNRRPAGAGIANKRFMVSLTHALRKHGHVAAQQPDGRHGNHH